MPGIFPNFHFFEYPKCSIFLTFRCIFKNRDLPFFLFLLHQQLEAVYLENRKIERTREAAYGTLLIRPIVRRTHLSLLKLREVAVHLLLAERERLVQRSAGDHRVRLELHPDRLLAAHQTHKHKQQQKQQQQIREEIGQIGHVQRQAKRRAPHTRHASTQSKRRDTRLVDRSHNQVQRK